MTEQQTLVEFLTARLDEDEQIAKAALGETEQPWTIDTEPDLPAKHVQGRPSIQTSGMGWQTTSGDGIWSCDDPDDDCRIYRREDMAEAEHIARHDPARVLREIAAKRAILEAHSCEWAERPERVIGEADDPFCASCIGELHPCLTVRHLAAPYSDHPDYNPEWSTT